MGLRIIERHRPKPREVSDAERLVELEAETRRWAETHAGTDGRSQLEQVYCEFLSNFHRVQARLKDGEPSGQSLGRARESILNLNNDGSLPHNQVDIATLLELL